MTAPTDNTPISILQDAFFDAGLIETGQSLDSEQIVMGMRKMTDLINVKQTRGLKLWLNTDYSITLVAGTGTYTLGPAGTVVMDKPLRVIQSYWLDPQGVRTPLTVLSWEEYMRLSQVNQEGALNSYFVNKQQSVLSVFFWLIPDATAALGTGHVLLQQQVTNFTAVNETMNFPIEWRIALRWGVADEICTGQPAAIVERCRERAAMYWEELEGWDVEDAPTRFAPDQRSQYYSSRFR